MYEKLVFILKFTFPILITGQLLHCVLEIHVILNLYSNEPGMEQNLRMTTNQTTAISTLKGPVFENKSHLVKR